MKTQTLCDGSFTKYNSIKGNMGAKLFEVLQHGPEADCI
jgi:hypothetical protein